MVLHLGRLGGAFPKTSVNHEKMTIAPETSLGSPLVPEKARSSSKRVLRSLGSRPYQGPSSRSRMDQAKLDRLIKEGFGEGRHDYFQPWMRIRRNYSSPVSWQHVLPLPGLRPVHLLSSLERRHALLASYLGALELREQVPWHPDARKHPGFDPTYRYVIPGTDVLAPGLVESARDLGIDPGVYPGTDLTFVLTTDLVLLVADEGTSKLVYWPVKPKAELTGPKNARRRERIALEERRAADVGAFFHLMTDETITEQLTKNLSAFTPHSSTLARLKGTDELHRFAECFDQCRSATLRDARAAAGSACGANQPQEQSRLFMVALHQGLIDVNLSEPLYPQLPVPWGGLARRKVMRRVLMGVSS